MRLPVVPDDEVSAQTARIADIPDDTPDVVIDLEVVSANIARIQHAADEHGVAVRPHVKTHKLPQIARMQLAAGAIGIQVAKLGEAEVMADGGIEDILVGYPIVGTRKLDRLVALSERARVTVTVDSLDVAEGISQAFKGAGRTVRALVELDTGMARLGVPPGDGALALAARVASLPGIDVRGVFTHEGHVYVQGHTQEEKSRLTQAACDAAAETAARLRGLGLDAVVVSVGSAGTFRFAVRCTGVTEVRPGTYVFNDVSQLAQGAAHPADVAAFVVATVVARPAADRIVIDAGSKVLTSDRMLVADPPPTFGAVWGHGDWQIVRLSEEHGVVQLPPGASVRVGDRVVIVPNHVCPAINLASTVTVVEGGGAVARWPVAARGLVR